MANEELKTRLDELKQLLETSHISPEDRNLLGHLMTDMVAIANSEEHAVEAEQSASYTERLERQANDFEQQHPTLAGILRQVADALGKMGI